MSKERARRRATRLAEVERSRSARDRAQARRVSRRKLARRLTPRLSVRRTGRLYPRRNSSQRALIAVVAMVVLGFIWLNVDSTATRIALTILIVVASPALIVLTFDRH